MVGVGGPDAARRRQRNAAAYAGDGKKDVPRDLGSRHRVGEPTPVASRNDVRPPRRAVEPSSREIDLGSKLKSKPDGGTWERLGCSDGVHTPWSRSDFRLYVDVDAVPEIIRN